MLKLWLAVLMTVLTLGTQVEAVGRMTDPLDITTGSKASISKLYYRLNEESVWIEITENTTGLPGDARVKAEIFYDDVLISDLQNHGGKMRYVLPEILNRANASGEISDGNVKVGTVTASDNQVVLAFEPEYLQKQADDKNTDVSGTITVEARFNLDKMVVQNPPKIVVGKVEISLGLEDDVYAKAAEVDVNKEIIQQSSGRYVIQTDAGDFLEYRVTVSVPANAAKAPEVKVIDQFTDKTYVGAYGSITPSSGSAAVDPVSGNLVWTIGDMQPGDTKTLTYRVALKDAYAVVAGDINFGNQAAAYSKNNSRDHATVNYKTSAKVTMSKVAGNYDAVNQMVTYTVWVKAEDGNTHRVDNVKLVDSMENSANASDSRYLQYLSYVAGSFGLYEGGVKDQNGANGLTLISNASGTVDASKKEFTYNMGSFAPGECKTLVYTVKVGQEVFGFQNGNVTINNRAQIYSDDTVTGGNQWYNAYNVKKVIGHKMWTRKLPGERVDVSAEIVFGDGDRVYNADKSANAVTKNFGVDIGNYRYRVLVNETADIDISSAVLKDSLGDKLNFNGYLQVQAYAKDSLNGIDFSKDDASVINSVVGKTPSSTAWLEVTGSNFSFSPNQLGFGTQGQYAYLLTYYTVPVNMGNNIQSVVGNTFTLSGRMVYGTGTGQYYDMAGVSVSVKTTIQRDSGLYIEKDAWYYEKPVAGAAAPWNNGALYWVIKLDGTVTSGVRLKEMLDNKQTSPVVVGVYEGALQAGESFTEKFKNLNILAEAIRSEIWSQIDSSKYQYENNIISFLENITTASGKSLYVIVKTAPTELPLGDRDTTVYMNTLEMSGDQGITWSKAGNASQMLYGSDGSFKELGGAFTYDLSKAQDKLTYISTEGKIINNPGAILVDQLPGSGTYVAWQIHVNYDGRTSGTVELTEMIPAGMELVYVRYYWLGDNLRSVQKQPTVTEITDLDATKWTHKTVSAPGIHTGTYQNTDLVCDYYYNKDENLARWNVKGLSQGPEKDKNAIEFQVVCKLVDDQLFAKGGTKTYNNTVEVKDVNPGRTVRDTSAVDISKQTLSKRGVHPDSGNIYPFVITVNELGEDLVQGSDVITLVDEMSSLLILDVLSINVVNTKTKAEVTGWTPRVIQTTDGQQLLLTLPDKTPLTITYNARVKAAPNSAPVSFSNEAYWYGAEPTKDTKVSVSNFQYSVSATVNADSHPRVKVVKVDRDNARNYLDGAVFELRKVTVGNSGEIQLAADALVGTTQNGELEFAGTEGARLEYNTIYRLKELKAPGGYLLDNAPYYFVVADTRGNKTIPTFPEWVLVESGSSAHTYVAYNEKATIKVEKVFFEDANGSAVMVQDIPDGNYRFGLFDSSDLDKAVQVLIIQRENGQISYKRDGASVGEPLFSEIDPEKTYDVYELDKDGRPVGNDERYIHSNGTTFKVSYRGGNSVRVVDGKKDVTIHNLILEKQDDSSGEPGEAEQSGNSKPAAPKGESKEKPKDKTENKTEDNYVEAKKSVSTPTGDLASLETYLIILAVSVIVFITIFIRKWYIMKK